MRNFRHITFICISVSLSSCFFTTDFHRYQWEFRKKIIYKYILKKGTIYNYLQQSRTQYDDLQLSKLNCRETRWFLKLMISKWEFLKRSLSLSKIIDLKSLPNREKKLKWKSVQVNVNKWIATKILGSFSPLFNWRSGTGLH